MAALPFGETIIMLTLMQLIIRGCGCALVDTGGGGFNLLFSLLPPTYSFYRDHLDKLFGMQPQIYGPVVLPDSRGV